jgi:hypothetical protein
MLVDYLSTWSSRRTWRWVIVGQIIVMSAAVCPPGMSTHVFSRPLRREYQWSVLNTLTAVGMHFLWMGKAHL